MSQSFDFKITHSVPRKRVQDVILSLTTTYSPWIAEVSWAKNTRDKFHLICKYDGEQDEEGTYKRTKQIVQATVERGLKAMAVSCGDRFSNIVKEEYDAIDADILMQYIVFGKIVYG